MDVLNNVNVILGIVVSIFGIIGTLFGVASHFINKANSAQRKQAAQLQSMQKPSSPPVVVQPLSKLDWMEVLWYGLEDTISAREWNGTIAVIMIAIFGGVILGMIGPEAFPHVLTLVFVVFYVLLATLIVLFYMYFVGRRIEKKFEEMNKPAPRRQKIV